MIKRITLPLIFIISFIYFPSLMFSQEKLDETTDKMVIKEFESTKYVDWIKEYVRVPLKTDLSKLSENDKLIIPLLLQVAKEIDKLYWLQSYGDEDELLNSIQSKEAKAITRINYGPWNRLHGNEPMFENIGAKPKGCNFYPKDMTKEEFEKFDNPLKTSLYTLIVRNEKGELECIPYHEAYHESIYNCAKILEVASKEAEDPGFSKYLRLRAEALLTDEYFESDMAWMDMKSNSIDFVVGPIENYEDQLFGYKAAYESFILIKDKEWSTRLEHYAKLLPRLQTELPVDKKYKSEVPGSNSDLGVYDAIFYSGDCNAGSKTIAINLPNDSRVQLEKGSRKLQLKNSMRAKFDNILSPIADELIAPSQRQNVKFDSFFENTMFHEVAHGLGIKITINGRGDVRQALKEQYSAWEEGKADILGLFLVTKLNEMGELNCNLMDNYVTFMAGIFRSIRFGTSSAHAKANLMRFNYFLEKGAFTKDEKGYYAINFEKMQDAMESLSSLIIQLQGDGDYEGVKATMIKYSVMSSELKNDLLRLEKANIPVDVVFQQGAKVLKED